MTGSNRLEETMLTNTLSAFRNSDHEAVSAAQGVTLLDGWLQALQGDPNLDQLTGQLNELRTALQVTPPDERYVRQLLAGLADQSQEIAEAPNSEGTWTGSLESLSKILRNFGHQAG